MKENVQKTIFKNPKQSKLTVKTKDYQKNTQMSFKNYQEAFKTFIKSNDKYSKDLEKDPTKILKPY